MTGLRAPAALDMIAQSLVALAPVPRGGSAGAAAGPEEDLSWLMAAPWGKAALILIAAMAVLFFANTMMERKRARARGRAARLDFDVAVARLEQLPATAIAAVTSGPVHLRGRILSATGRLGSRDGHARVWHNRAGSGRRTAVGAELVIVGDDTGQVGIGNLEDARVIAPRDAGRPHDTVSLYVGDLVEVLGHVTAERHGQARDPSHNVYGMLGLAGQVQLRLLARYDAADVGSQGLVVDPLSSPDLPP